MGSKQFANWLQTVLHTQSEEIPCSECFDLVSSYVELEIEGRNPTDRFPQVTQHLTQCPACREEYETLRDLCHLENEQGFPSVNDLRKKIH